MINSNNDILDGQTNVVVSSKVDCQLNMLGRRRIDDVSRETRDVAGVLRGRSLRNWAGICKILDLLSLLRAFY